MMESEPTVYIVDDDTSVCKGLKRLLLSEGLNSKTFSSAKEFLDCGVCKGPGCIVLDVNMPELSGLDLQEELTKIGNFLPCIFITAYANVPISVKAMKGGAIDFLEKPFADGEFLEAVKSAMEKGKSSFCAQEEESENKKRLEMLTSREMNILKEVITGKLNKQIASDLGIKENTVKVHRKNIMDKLDIHSVAELVRLTERIGI
jgi:FixJ family two-component response regulator